MTENIFFAKVALTTPDLPEGHSAPEDFSAPEGHSDKRPKVDYVEKPVAGDQFNFRCAQIIILSPSAVTGARPFACDAQVLLGCCRRARRARGGGG